MTGMRRLSITMLSILVMINALACDDFLSIEVKNGSGLPVDISGTLTEGPVEPRGLPIGAEYPCCFRSKPLPPGESRLVGTGWVVDMSAPPFRRGSYTLYAISEEGKIISSQSYSWIELEDLNWSVTLVDQR
jgi:hypothetical protein